MENIIIGAMGLFAAGYLARRAYKATKSDSGCAGGCEGCCGCGSPGGSAKKK